MICIKIPIIFFRTDQYKLTNRLYMEKKSGYELLRDPRKNKGTAFTHEEREKYALEGLLPTQVETLAKPVRNSGIFRVGSEVCSFL